MTSLTPHCRRRPPFCRWLPAAAFLCGASVVASPLALVPQVALAAGQDKNAVAAWETFPFDKEIADQAKLDALEEADLKRLRGIVFGRHGRVFDEAEIQNWLKTRPWYKPDPTYRVEVLNGPERENMDRIKLAEYKKHDELETGDLKFWRDRRIPSAKVGEHTGAEWLILAAEVEAIHGKTFRDQPWLQQFFDERYWYKPNPAYSPKRLNAFERANLELIRTSWRKSRKVAVSPGDMGVFKDKPLTSALLRGVGLYELRLLRNEVYARRGQRFRRKWLSSYFASEPWYTPTLPLGKEAKLSPIEQKNVALIVARENELHESLSRKPLPPGLLNELPLEDVRRLRNEIYARRGRTFKDTSLQSYFASLPWYKPNPAFRESRLTKVEERNAAEIARREKEMIAAVRTVAA